MNDSLSNKEKESINKKRKKLSYLRKRENIIGLDLNEEYFPEVFTAHPFPSLEEREGIFITKGAEKLIYDGRKIVVDLFSGCGGFSLGFAQAGFRIVASVENDEMAHTTYAYNIPTYQNAPIHCYSKDIRKISGYEILMNLGLKPGEVDLVIGGPPCPSFSLAGKRKVGDVRDSLLLEFKRLVMEIQPKAWVMENVPGLKSKKDVDGVLIIDKFLEGMNMTTRMESTKEKKTGNIGDINKIVKEINHGRNMC